jgi:hypothetical protein
MFLKQFLLIKDSLIVLSEELFKKMKIIYVRQEIRKGLKRII